MSPTLGNKADALQVVGASSPEHDSVNEEEEAATQVSGAQPTAVTCSRLVADLRRLGVRPGGITMVHTRMSASGWVVGGSETIVRALLRALGPDGTLAAFAAWDDHPYNLAEWPEEHRAAYLAEPPVFDLATAEADRGHGRIPERVRTWPGAYRSSHPEASVVAVGARAKRLTDAHPQEDAFGSDSPFARPAVVTTHV